jgi:hypothetical protein
MRLCLSKLLPDLESVVTDLRSGLRMRGIDYLETNRN